MNPESSEDQLDRVKAEIRADADVARQRAPLPERNIAAATRVRRDAAFDPDRVTIDALARHAGPEFVDRAYRAILKREPDPAGMERHMAALGAGANKIELIGDLRYSAEGRRRGASIPGLAPRYVLGKLGRVPVLGALVQWLVALASLPHMLRHQRATEASLAVRFGEAQAALRAAEARDAEQREAIGALTHANAELSERIGQLETYARAIDATANDLRSLVLAMNHWTVEVRKSIDAIEAAEDERRAEIAETSAANVAHERRDDPDRARRLAARTAELARRLSDAAIVVDLCGGPDWLAALAAHGWTVSAIETNAALHRDARARGLDVTLGEPAALLARVADASIDALTVNARDASFDEATTTGLVREARRVVRHGGVLLIDAGVPNVAARWAGVALESGFEATPSSDASADHGLMFVRS